MSKPIARLYYYETESSEWYLTMDKQVATQGFNTRDANLNDLDDLGCIGGIITDKILNIAEGCYEWNSEAITYENGEKYGDYEIVWDLKERVLDRMEQLEMENSFKYEEVVGMNQWKAMSLLDMNEGIIN